MRLPSRESAARARVRRRPWAPDVRGSRRLLRVWLVSRGLLGRKRRAARDCKISGFKISSRDFNCGVAVVGGSEGLGGWFRFRNKVAQCRALRVEGGPTVAKWFSKLMDRRCKGRACARLPHTFLRKVWRGGSPSHARNRSLSLFVDGIRWLEYADVRWASSKGQARDISEFFSGHVWDVRS